MFALTSDNVFNYLGRIGFGIRRPNGETCPLGKGDSKGISLLAITEGGSVIYVQPPIGLSLEGQYVFHPNRRTASSRVEVVSIDDGFSLAFRKPVFGRDCTPEMREYSKMYLATKGISRWISR